MSKSEKNEAVVLQEIISGLSPLEQDVRARLLQTVSTFFNISGSNLRRTPAAEPSAPISSNVDARFSDHQSISPKAFLFEKNPKTDVERVACLAFYLTHYRDTPHFKTLDINKLNTEAAQSKFSNAAYSVDNATKMGYLVPATKGNKQMSAPGEQFVQALPDRDAAKSVLDRIKPRRNRKSPGGKTKSE